MNWKQKIVLTIGGVVLILVLWLPPRFTGGLRIIGRPPPLDTITLITRVLTVVIIVGVTIALLGCKKK